MAGYAGPSGGWGGGREAAMGKAEKLEWMQRISAVQRALCPENVLGETQPEAELRDTEYGLCEVMHGQRFTPHTL